MSDPGDECGCGECTPELRPVAVYASELEEAWGAFYRGEGPRPTILDDLLPPAA